MAITGKTGADAMLKFLTLILALMHRYETKFLAFSDAQWSAGHITAAQNTLVHDFVGQLPAVRNAVKILADYTNVN